MCERQGVLWQGMRKPVEMPGPEEGDWAWLGVV